MSTTHIPDRPEVDEHSGPDLTLETVDLDAVGRFSGGVQIRTIRTVSTYSHLRCRPEDVASEWYEQAWIGFDSHVHGEGTDEHPLRVAALMFAHYDRSRTDADEPVPPSEDDDPDDLEIAVRFELTYDWLRDEAPDLDDFVHFGYYNGTFNAWPYWREYAQQVTTRMGITPLVVPVFRVRKTS